VTAPKKSRPRFFIDPDCVDRQSGRARLADEARLSHQVRNVLRLKVGDTVDLLDGQGNLFGAELASVGRTFIEFVLTSVAATVLEPSPAFSLTSCLPLIKAQRFEWALEKLSELGVSTISPFQSDRCMVKLKSEEEGRSKRWLAICKEASEQCERLTLPHLLEPVSLAQLLLGRKSTQTDDRPQLNLLLSERNNKAPDMVSTLYNLKARQKQAGLATDLMVLSGPEGGFNEEELASIAQHNFLPVTLGTLVLRSETACILAAGLVSAVNAGEG